MRVYANSTAIAATVAMVTFALGCFGLYLRINESQIVWMAEATAYRPASLVPRGIEHRASTGMVGHFRASRSFDSEYENGATKRPSSLYGAGQGIGGGYPIQVTTMPPEEETIREEDLHLPKSMPKDPRA
jgi:hypothetical protein